MDTPTILLVDDQKMLLDLYEFYLSSTYDVRTARRGEQALAVIDEEIDVGLLDRQIPDLSGDEVLSLLRQRGYQFPVAMLTAVEPDVDIIDMQFDDYILKPVEREPLLNRVEALVRRREFSDESRELVQLAAKKAALEYSDNINVESSSKYDELVDWIQELEAELGRTVEDLEHGIPKIA